MLRCQKLHIPLLTGITYPISLACAKPRLIGKLCWTKYCCILASADHSWRLCINRYIPENVLYTFIVSTYNAANVPMGASDTNHQQRHVSVGMGNVVKYYGILLRRIRMAKCHLRMSHTHIYTRSVGSVDVCA
jgi:hypothetical protein